MAAEPISDSGCRRMERFPLRTRKLYGLLLCLFFSRFLVVAAQVNNNNNNNNNQSGNSTTNQDGIVQVLENEIWDAANNSWKAVGERWTNERGQSCSSPSELQAPAGFEFEGEWKIVVTSGDSMGWEYQFQYLRPPKRRRIWLRSLRQQPQIIVKPRQPSKSLTKTLARIRDDYNFKGFGLSFYKSLVFPSSFGLALRLPLTMNFDWWDRHPELPSVSSGLVFYFPWTIAAYLETSLHVEWIKWVLKSVLGVISKLAVLVIYQLVLPFVWLVSSTIFFPLRTKLPPLPTPPNIAIAKPRYNPEMSERIGCSVSYRWSKLRGFESRFNYWHVYLPTLMVYQKLLNTKLPLDSEWWQKHFGSIGLSSVYPLPFPPHFSCSALLSLSGLYLKKRESAIDKQSTIIAIKNEGEEQKLIREQAEPTVSSRMLSSVKTVNEKVM